MLCEETLVSSGKKKVCHGKQLRCISEWLLLIALCQTMWEPSGVLGDRTYRSVPPLPPRSPHPQKFLTIMVFYTQLPAVCQNDHLHVPIHLGSSGFCSRNTDLGCHSLGLLAITLQSHFKKSLWFSVYSSFLVIWVGVTVSKLFTYWSWNWTSLPCPGDSRALFSPAQAQQSSRCPRGSDSIGKALGGPWYCGRSQWRLVQSTLSSAKKEVLILSPVPVTVSNQEVKAPGTEKW